MPTKQQKGELEQDKDLDDLKPYYEILTISMKNPSVATTFKNTENEQIYQ